MATATAEAAWQEFATRERPEPKRDRWGRYLIKPLDGGKPKSHARATTIAETLDDRYNLERWKVRTSALGFALRPDLYAQLTATKPEDKDTLNRLCDEAREAAAGSAGANLGSALHTFIERINLGEDVEVPAPWNADIKAWRDALEQAAVRIAPELVERILVLPDYTVAGMADMGVYVGDDPLLKIADLKTGATLDWSWCSICVQMAIYSRAKTIYDPDTESHVPMPEVDQESALIMHLPAGEAACTLYWVNIEAGWEAFEHSMWAREWRKRKSGLAVPIAEAVAQTDEGDLLAERRAWLIDRLTRLREDHPAAFEQVAEHWPEAVPTFKAAESHTHAQMDLIAAVCDDVEATHQLPFGDLDPAAEPPRTDELDGVKARLDTLPDDVADGVLAAAKEAGIPNLRSTEARRAHLRRVKALLDQAEANARDRTEALERLLSDLSTDTQVAVYEAIDADRVHPEAHHLDDARCVVAAMHADVFELDGDRLVVRDEAAREIEEAFGGKRPAISAAKEIARSRGRETPRSFADVTGDALLVAHLTGTNRDTPEEPGG